MIAILIILPFISGLGLLIYLLVCLERVEENLSRMEFNLKYTECSSCGGIYLKTHYSGESILYVCRSCRNEFEMNRKYYF